MRCGALLFATTVLFDVHHAVGDELAGDGERRGEIPTWIVTKIEHNLVAAGVNDLLEGDAELIGGDVGELIECDVVDAVSRCSLELLCCYRREFNLGAHNGHITWLRRPCANGDDDSRPLCAAHLEHRLIHGEPGEGVAINGEERIATKDPCGTCRRTLNG